MADLTPYDTGERAEPYVWLVPYTDQVNQPPLTEDEQRDRYGKVDFEDENGEMVATVWIERLSTGAYAVHVQAWDPTLFINHRSAR